MTQKIPPLAALSSWARDRYGGSWPLRAHVLKFIRSYQETSVEPKVFVGRAGLLRELDQWLQQSDPRVLLVSGAAGRGKSALLLHWLDSLLQRDGAPTVLYLPISIRFNTADATAGVQLLFAALCDVFPRLKAQLPQQPETQDYLQGITAGWRQMARRSEASFLLVIDGLDEAVNGWLIERPLLPKKLPPNLHVLLAARHPPGHASGQAWLAPLCQEGTAAQVREIGTLERGALGEALLQLRPPLDRLAEQAAFTDHLYRLTDAGDPLLLTLWLAQIWRARDALPDLTPEALAELAPGFGELYRLWRAEQQSLWAGAGLDIQAADFQQVMQVLATAQGPLRVADLVELLSALSPGRWETQALRAVLDTAQRLVAGDETGYALVHPRLAQHFQEALEADPPRKRAVNAAFRAWGAATVRRLNSLELPPGECPAYLLTHYVAVHLDAGEDPLADDDDLPLLRQGWAQAWHAHEGAWHGYLNDLRHLARRRQALNQARVRAGAAPRLAPEVRGALLAMSIRSMIRRIPPKLLTYLAREGVWSLARTARVARQLDPTSQAQSLTELAEVAAAQGEPTEATGLLQEAATAAAAIADATERATALMRAAAQLTGDARRAVVPQALAAVAAIPYEADRAAALGRIGFLLEEEAALLQQGLALARAIEDGGSRYWALIRLATHLQGDARRTAFQQALTAIAENAAAWSEATRWMDTLAQADPALLQQAIRLAARIEDRYERTRALGAAAAHLEGPAQRTLLEQVLAAAAEVPPRERLEVLCEVADLLGEEARSGFLQQALASGETGSKREGEEAQEEEEILDPHQPPAARRALALCEIARPLKGPARHTVLRQALAEAASLLSEEGGSPHREPLYLAMTFEHTLARQLRGDRILLQQALTIVARIRHPELKGGVLVALAPGFREDSGLWQQALAVAGAIQDGSSQARALLEVARPLHGELKRTVLQRTLTATVTIPDGRLRAGVLSELAAHLGPDTALLQQALVAAEAIESAHPRAVALNAVASQLTGEARTCALERSLEAAAAIQGEQPRATALSTVASQLTGEGRIRAFQQAIAAAAAIPDPRDRAGALGAVAKELAADRPLLAQVLEAAAAIQEPVMRAITLGHVAEHFGGEEALLRQALAAAIPDTRTPEAAPDQPGGAGGNLAQPVLKMAARIPEGRDRIRTLCRMATQLQGEARRTLAREALADAATLYEAQVADALESVLGLLPADSALLRRALELAAAMQDDSERASALRVVAPHLGTDSALARQALELAVAIPDDRHRASALGNVLRHLWADNTLLQQALEATAAIQNEEARSQALKEVAAQRPGDRTIWGEALRQARELPSPEWRAEALTAVAARLGPDTQGAVLAEAHEAAALIPDELRRVWVLSAVARQPQEDIARAAFKQALTAVAALEDPGLRASHLSTLTGQLPQDRELAIACLQEVLKLPDTDPARITITVSLLRHDPALLTYELWVHLLQPARLDRPALLHAIGELTGCAVALAGRTEEAQEIAEAIHDVCEWFP